MASDTAILKNPNTGQIRRAPVGFSWTMFFFGPFAAMIRGDWKWAVILFITSIGISILTAGLLGWLPGVIGAALWNKSYLDRLVSDGYQLKATKNGHDFDHIDQTLGYSVKRFDDTNNSGRTDRVVTVKA